MSSESHTSTHDSEAANMLAHVEANGDMVASVFNELRTDLASPYSESQVAIDSLRFASQEAIRNARLLQDIAGTLPLRFDASPSNQAISELRRKVSLSSRSEASADILVDDAATLRATQAHVVWMNPKVGGYGEDSRDQPFQPYYIVGERRGAAAKRWTSILLMPVTVINGERRRDLTKFEESARVIAVKTKQLENFKKRLVHQKPTREELQELYDPETEKLLLNQFSQGSTSIEGSRSRTSRTNKPEVIGYKKDSHEVLEAGVSRDILRDFNVGEYIGRLTAVFGVTDRTRDVITKWAAQSTLSPEDKLLESSTR